MIQCVLIAHHLSPDGNYPDGGAFICTNRGTARNFETVDAARQHISDYGLNDAAPIWNIFLLTEIPLTKVD